MKRKIDKSFFPLFSAVLTMTVLLAGTANSQTSVFFDDFNYTSSTDSNLLNFGWSPRSGGAGLREILKETVTANLALLALITGLFVLVRFHGRVLEQEAAQSAQQLASHDLQLAKFMSALSSEARSKTSAIEANIRLLLREYGGFLPRHAHKCAEQIEEASAQLEQLRQDLVGDSRPNDDEKAMYQTVA